MPRRPRAPGYGEGGGPGNRRWLAWTTIGVVVAVLAVTGAFAAVVLLSGRGGTEPDQVEVSADPVFLPLDLVDVGFDGGTVTLLADDEGPGATSFCGQAPITDGLTLWAANRLTDAGDSRRVIQQLVRFETDVEATGFVASHSTIAACGSWEATNRAGSAFQFTVIESSPVNRYADETRQYDLVADDPDGRVFLRVVLVRYRADVVQLTLASADESDLAGLDELVAVVVDELGWA